jgi:hypothetical protein
MAGFQEVGGPNALGEALGMAGGFLASNPARKEKQAERERQSKQDDQNAQLTAINIARGQQEVTSVSKKEEADKARALHLQQLQLGQTPAGHEPAQPLNPSDPKSFAAWYGYYNAAANYLRSFPETASDAVPYQRELDAMRPKAFTPAQQYEAQHGSQMPAYADLHPKPVPKTPQNKKTELENAFFQKHGFWPPTGDPNKITPYQRAELGIQEQRLSLDETRANNADSRAAFNEARAAGRLSPQAEVLEHTITQHNLSSAQAIRAVQSDKSLTDQDRATMASAYSSVPDKQPSLADKDRHSTDAETNKLIESVGRLRSQTNPSTGAPYTSDEIRAAIQTSKKFSAAAKIKALSTLGPQKQQP